MKDKFLDRNGNEVKVGNWIFSLYPSGDGKLIGKVIAIHGRNSCYITTKEYCILLVYPTEVLLTTYDEVLIHILEV
jgi:hypothetical protein